MNADPMIVMPLHATWLTADGVGKMLGGRDGRQWAASALRALLGSRHEERKS